VCRAAGLHDNGGGWQLRQSEREQLARVALLPCHLAGVERDADLEDPSLPISGETVGLLRLV